ncbi:MAG: ral nucleoside transport system ATP-binding protein [Synergistaceae bacterium]|nr:ral nucleoside transport system ATP-binding protein [Synergistaceae bacterium]
MNQRQPLVRMEKITKRFAGVTANHEVDFDVRPGEVHALLGENGAGKSTLMNILYGLYRPDSGSLFIDGNETAFASPGDARKAGIGMVHQHFMLIPSQTVWENMILGLDGLPCILPKNDIRDKIVSLSSRYGLMVDPDAGIWQLSIGEQQRVAILQMLFRQANILILDEPTAVLTPQEAELLFETVRQMTSEGHGVVFISHKMDEVMGLSQRVTILRKGKLVGTVETASTSKEQLAEMMVGQKMVYTVSKPPLEPGDPVLECASVCALGDRGFPAVNHATFLVRRREILGIAGVAGNGQQELCETLVGLRKVESGTIHVNGREMTNALPKDFIRQGVHYIPADRKGTGLVPNMNVSENSILKRYWIPPVSRGPFLNWKEVFSFARELVSRFNVSTPSIETPVRNLSGGNLQKLMLGRELSDSPVALLAVHPTWGLDVAATKFVREQLLCHRERGGAVLLVSEDLDELLALSDRLAVMCKGEIMGILDNPSSVPVETIGLMMAGTPLEELEKRDGGTVR